MNCFQTVVAHELGHDHTGAATEDDVMSETLASDTRPTTLDSIDDFF